MQELPVAQTIQEMNRKIRPGKAVVYTAQEIIGVVKQKGLQPAVVEVDVVNPGSFGPRCSSGPPMAAKLGRAFGDHPFYPLGSDNL
jgi:uncharacterized protein (DUF39 family)